MRNVGWQTTVHPRSALWQMVPFVEPNSIFYELIGVYRNSRDVETYQLACGITNQQIRIPNRPSDTARSSWPANLH